jgi:DNA-binding transcriptional ArsR family regulator
MTVKHEPDRHAQRDLRRTRRPHAPRHPGAALAEPFPISLPAVSRHLKVLEGAGLIARDRSAQWRPSVLRTEPLEEATDWLETYRVIWEGRMDALDTHLKKRRKRK